MLPGVQGVALRCRQLKFYINHLARAKSEEEEEKEEEEDLV